MKMDDGALLWKNNRHIRWFGEYEEVQEVGWQRVGEGEK